MSDCGVCVTTGYADECTGYRCVIVKAGRQWECSECGCKIPKGERKAAGMMCEVSEIIGKNEQFARGWIRLYENSENTSTAAEMGQYAIELMKLRRAHEERCWLCKQKGKKRA